LKWAEGGHKKLKREGWERGRLIILQVRGSEHGTRPQGEGKGASPYSKLSSDVVKPSARGNLSGNRRVLKRKRFGIQE